MTIFKKKATDIQETKKLSCPVGMAMVTPASRQASKYFLRFIRFVPPLSSNRTENTHAFSSAFHIFSACHLLTDAFKNVVGNLFMYCTSRSPDTYMVHNNFDTNM